MTSKLEEFLMRLGQPGRLQCIASFFLIFSFMHGIAMNYFISFITMTPSHHCKLPEGWQYPQNISIPQHNTSSGVLVYQQCKIYKDPLNQSLGFDDCPTGEYEFLHEDGERLSTITEWGLVCAKKYLVRIYQTCYFVGVMMGGFSCGFLADNYGRRTTWMIAAFVQAGFGIATAFVSTFETSCFLLVVRGMFIQGQITVSNTMMMEMFPLKYRTKAGIITLAMPALSLAYANLFAYFVMEWRYQILVHSLSSIVIIIGFWFVKESFRWMLSHQRIEQALSTAQAVARFNKVTLPKSLESDLKGIAAEIQSTLKSDKKQTIVDLLRHPFIRWTCLILCFNMFLAQICVYGFNFLIKEIGGNVYLNFLIVAIVDFLMRGTSYITVEKLGRTLTTVGALLIMGVMNLIFTVTKTYQDDYPSLATVSLVVSLIGRIFNGVFFCAAVMHSSEIFPTTVRSTASGVLMATGRLGLLMLPVILLLGDYIWKQLPFLVFGIGSIIAGLLSLMLPETQGTVIPNTIEEASKLRKSKKPSNKRTADIEEMKVVEPMLKDELKNSQNQTQA